MVKRMAVEKALEREEEVCKKVRCMNNALPNHSNKKGMGK